MARAKGLVLSILVILIAISMHPVRADWVFVQRTYDGSFNVYSVDDYALHAYQLAGYQVRIDFTCTAGGSHDINFFVCDEGNYSLFASGYTADVYCLQTQVVSWTGEFAFPYDDTWYYVFENPDAFYGRTIQLTLDLYEWRNLPPTNPAWMGLEIIGGIAALAISVVAIVAVVIVVNQRQRAPPPTPPTSPTQPAQPEATGRFCPQCRRPLEAAAGFCTNCGYKV